MSKVFLAFVLAALLPFAARPDDPATFSSTVRLVEVYATVLDHRGRYLKGLERDQFTVRDNGEPQPIAAFEAAEIGHMSCAILMDATGSMAKDLPVLKRSISDFADGLPDQARVAIFGFNSGMNVVQDFTTDRRAAKVKVSRMTASGTTALFDAIVQTARRIAGEKGKKFIVVFTDGEDNASSLNAGSAIARARRLGIPVYAVAEGNATRRQNLLKVLKEISEQTGGAVHVVRKSSEIEKVFLGIREEMVHTYLLAYKAPETATKEWRRIDVAVAAQKGASVRAKQGYLP